MIYTEAINYLKDKTELVGIDNLRKITLKHLETWPLYDTKHKVMAGDIGSGGLWLRYRTTPFNRPCGTTSFDVNIIKGVFFVLSISVEYRFRGKGYGDALYKVLEEIAKGVGCDQIQMTPSGWTPAGDTVQSENGWWHALLHDAVILRKVFSGRI